MAQYKADERYLDPRSINVLPQMRMTFEKIDELADSIFRNGLIHPITVAELNLDETRKYVEIINRVHESHVLVDNLICLNGLYLILVSGERRLRAYGLLHERSIDGFSLIRSTVCPQMNLEDLIDLQGSENTNDPVKPEEEAIFYHRYYRFLRETKNSITVAEFARKVGRSSQVVSTALRFAKLPRYIQDCVFNKTLQYGIACELARLQSAGIEDELLKDWFIRSALHTKNVEAFRLVVKKYLDDLHNGQTSLVDMFTTESESEMRKNQRRRSIEKNTSDMFYASNAYFLRLLYLFDQKLIGLEDSPFSMSGPLGVFEKQIELLEKLLPHLDALIETTRAQDVLKESRARINKLKKSIHA